MGYIPPHLRGEGGGAIQSSSSSRANGASSGYERPGMRGRTASSASLDKEGQQPQPQHTIRCHTPD